MTAFTLALVFEVEDHVRVEPRHLRVLEAVAAAGSLTGAARRLGLSYRGVCNAVSRLNNLFGIPLVEGVVGGAGGGGARITPAGELFQQSCRRLDLQLQDLADDLGKQIISIGRSDATVFSPAELTVSE